MGDLVEKIRLVQKTGNPIITQAVGEEIAKYQPVLKAAKVSSWKKLAQGGTVYSIMWQDSETILTFSKKDEKGRFIYDLENKFATDTELEKIIPVMLADIHTHPELLKEDTSNQKRK
jgi:hypothetical protein